MKSRSLKYLMLLVGLSTLALFALPSYAELPHFLPRSSTATVTASSSSSVGTTAATTTATTAVTSAATRTAAASSGMLGDAERDGAFLLGIIIAIVVVAIIVLIAFMLIPKRDNDGGSGRD